MLASNNFRKPPHRFIRIHLVNVIYEQSLGRAPRISERALAEFIEMFDEMMFMSARRGPDDMSFDIMRRLDRPLRHLCMEAGITDMYDRHRLRMREMFGSPPEKEQKAETTGDEKK